MAIAVVTGPAPVLQFYRQWVRLLSSLSKKQPPIYSISTVGSGSIFTTFSIGKRNCPNRKRGPTILALSKADSDELQQLSVAEHKVWDEAVSYYGHSLVKHDLVFDDDLVQIKDQLEDAEASSDLANAKILADLKAARLRVAPIYRKPWWERHNAGNKDASKIPSACHYAYGKG
jgi:hypothetical protein